MARPFPLWPKIQAFLLLLLYTPAADPVNIILYMPRYLQHFEYYIYEKMSLVCPK